MNDIDNPDLKNVGLDKVRDRLTRIRGNPESGPDASIVVPVNAQGDLDNLLLLVGDIARYHGNHTFEVIPIINNYPPDNPPEQIEKLRDLGLRVVSIPNARRPGEKVGFSARLPGVRVASSSVTIHFDADCRVPDSTALLDYYVGQVSSDVVLAYTPVQFYDLPSGFSVRCRIALHHAVRWIKRNLLQVPTARGSNYAIDRSLMLQLYGTGKLTEDFQIGPNVKAMGGKHAYSGDRKLTVLTSGRMFSGSWRRLFTYIRWRLFFNFDLLRDTGAARSLKRS